MATSGSISEYITGREYRIEWNASQDVAGNYSVITCTHYLINNSGYDLYIGDRNNYCEVDGSEDSYTSPSISTGGGSTIELGTTTHTVYHNADGTKTAAISGIFYIQANLSGYYVDRITASGSIELDRIPRSATITNAPNFTDEDAPTVTYSNSAGSAVQELLLGIFDNDGQEEIVQYREVSKTGGSYTFTFTEAERSALQAFVASTKSATVRFYMRTQLGGEYYYSSVQKTLTIANAAPTVSLTATDTNGATAALTGNASVMVLGKSNARVVVTATAKKGASIKAYSVTAGSKKATTATSTLNAVDGGNFAATVTDTRGYQVTAKLTAQTVAYVPLTCSQKVGMPTAAGVCALTIKGDYFNGSFGATANTLTVQYRRSEDGGATWGNWITATATKSGNTYSAAVTVTGMDYQKSHTFQARATDKLGTVATQTITVKTIPVFDWSETDFNTNVLARFLAGANVDGSFETSANAPATFNGSADFKGGFSIGGVGVGDFVTDYGSSGIWHYWKFNSGLAICYGVFSASYAINDAWGNIYESEGYFAGQSYPFTFAEAPACFPVTRSTSGGAYTWVCAGTGTESTSPRFYLCRPTPAASSDYDIGLFAVGAWKQWE